MVDGEGVANAKDALDEGVPCPVSSVFPRGERAAPAPAVVASKGLREAVRSMRPLLMRAVWLDTAAVRARAVPSLSARWLEPHDLYEASLDPAFDIESDFIEAALAKGDLCFGVFEDGRLASYAWYARTPTTVAFGLKVSWTHPSTRYMYKGFTRSSARGRGLYAAGLAAAALALAHEHGVRSIFAFIRRGNAASERAAARVGYRRGGTLVMARHYHWAYARRAACERQLHLGSG